MSTGSPTAHRPFLGLLLLDADGHLEADDEARRLLAGSAEVDDRLQQLATAVGTATDRPSRLRVVLPEAGDGEALALDLDLRSIGESTLISIVDEQGPGQQDAEQQDASNSSALGGDRSSQRGQLEQEGAIAIAAGPIHRRTSHDFRGLLNSISLNLTLLARGARGELDHLADRRERQLGWIEAIDEGVGSMNLLLETWTRLLAPPENDAPTSLDLRRSLGDLDLATTPLAQWKNLDLEVRQPQEALPIEAPVETLGRLLTALAAISMVGVGDGGRLLLDSKEEHGEVVLTVSTRAQDEGPDGVSSAGEGPDEEANADGNTTGTSPGTKGSAEPGSAGSADAELLPIFARLLEESGARAHLERWDYWTVRWPARRSGDGEERASDE